MRLVNKSMLFTHRELDEIIMMMLEISERSFDFFLFDSYESFMELAKGQANADFFKRVEDGTFQATFNPTQPHIALFAFNLSNDERDAKRIEALFSLFHEARHCFQYKNPSVFQKQIEAYDMNQDSRTYNDQPLEVDANNIAERMMLKNKLKIGRLLNIDPIRLDAYFKSIEKNQRRTFYGHYLMWQNNRKLKRHNQKTFLYG